MNAFPVINLDNTTLTQPFSDLGAFAGYYSEENFFLSLLGCFQMYLCFLFFFKFVI